MGAPPDVSAAGVHWDAAPVGHWESTDDQSEQREGGEHWEEGGHWDQSDGPSQPWGEGSGHWDAPYGQWDENGEWHSPAEHDGDDGSGHEGNGHSASGYNRADFAIAGRDAGQNAGQDVGRDEGRWDSANYPSYGGYPGRYRDEPEAGEKEAGEKGDAGGGTAAAGAARGGRPWPGCQPTLDPAGPARQAAVAARRGRRRAASGPEPSSWPRRAWW